MNVEYAIRYFVAALGRKGNDFTDLSFRRVRQKLITQVPLLQGQLLEFYEWLDFERLAVGGEWGLWFRPFTELEQAQQIQHLSTFRENPKMAKPFFWRNTWIVFAERDDNPLFVDASSEKVYGTFGARRFMLLGESFGEFLMLLAECMHLEDKQYHFNTMDVSGKAGPSFIRDVAQIAEKYNPGQSGQFMEFFFR